MIRPRPGFIKGEVRATGKDKGAREGGSQLLAPPSPNQELIQATYRVANPTGPVSAGAALASGSD